MNSAKDQFSPEELKLLRKRAEESLFFFVKGILGRDRFVKRIHKPICDALQNAELKDLLIVLPRSWYKSTLILAYILWTGLKNPNTRILFVQNTATNAVAKLNTLKTIIETNDLLRALWPEVLPDETCTWRAGSLCLKRTSVFPESTFEAIGVGGAITGRHYDIVVEDDTVCPDADDMSESLAVPSKDDIAKAIGYHNSLASIFDDPTNYRSIVVGTRWAERDLISHIRTSMGENVHVIERACLEKDGIPDEKGEPTFPEVFNHKALDVIRSKWGPYMFSCLYMNKPVRAEDMVFKEEWIQEFLTEELGLEIFTSVDLAPDPALSKSSDPDFCVVMTTGKHKKTGRVYVLDYSHKRLDPGQLVDEIFLHTHRWKPLKVLIPKVGYESSLAFWAKEKMVKENHFFNVEFFTYSRGTKEDRISGLVPLFSNNLIYIKGWMKELRGELLSFPLGSHDDLLDALSMQLKCWGVVDTSKTQYKPENGGPLSFDQVYKEHLAKKEIVKHNPFGEVYENVSWTSTPLEFVGMFLENS